MNEREHIKALCLEIYSTGRIICPYCAGGSSREISMSVKRTEAGILFNCKRASCGKNGFVGSNNSKLVVMDKYIKKTRAYIGDVVPLPENVWAKHLEKYGISYQESEIQGIRYCPDIGRMYFPVLDCAGWQIGEVLRACNGQQPKALHNKLSSEQAFIHFPLRAETTEVLVLVEDQTSAIKVSKIITCAALLGTQCPDETIMYIKGCGFKRIYLFLDGDTAGTIATNKLRAKLSPFFSEVRAVYCPNGNDPKDLSIYSIEELVHI